MSSAVDEVAVLARRCARKALLDGNCYSRDGLTAHMGGAAASQEVSPSEDQCSYSGLQCSAFLAQMS